jgi:hypothetical protein
MINGFTGMSLERFLRNTNEAMELAHAGHSRDPFAGVAPGEVSLPQLSTPINKRPPFGTESAFGGRHRTGVGSSANIVVDQSVYDNVLRMADDADGQAGEDIYRIAEAIENMCSSIYVVPETVPKVLAITSQIKSSLSQFRSMTENVCIQTRRFVNEIRHIDRAHSSFLFVLNRSSANDTISSVSDAMKQQSGNMKNTSQELQSKSKSLREHAREFKDEARNMRKEVASLQIQLRDLREQIRREQERIRQKNALMQQPLFIPTTGVFSQQ